MIYAVEIYGISTNQMEQTTQLGILLQKTHSREEALVEAIKFCAKCLDNYNDKAYGEMPEWLHQYFTMESIGGYKTRSIQHMYFKVLS